LAVNVSARVTWLVVGAVAAVGLAAAVDGLRGEGEAARPPGTTTASTSEREPAGSAARGDLEFPPPVLSSRARVLALLARAEARGALYVADMSCRLRALRLPEVEWLAEPAAPLAPCRFTVDANGLLFPDDAVFARGAELGAVCSDGAVGIFGERRPVALATVAGCSPAWKPDGSLTVLRKGELVQATGLDQERVVLSHEDVVRALGPRTQLLEVAWLDNESFGVALRRNGLFELAVFRGRHLVARPSFSSTRIEGLQAGASGLLAAETGTPQFAVSFFDRRGRLLLSVGGRAFSWQPEGVVAAVAGRLQTLFVAPLTRDVASLPLFASDLEWRCGRPALLRPDGAGIEDVRRRNPALRAGCSRASGTGAVRAS
jgi:hypothetical protein